MIEGNDLALKMAREREREREVIIRSTKTLKGLQGNIINGVRHIKKFDI